MKQITAREFKTAVKLNPAWASKLTEPVEITDFCDMTASNITHLSPLLHFTGRNSDGDCASFTSCKNLKVAEGHFAGWVTFSDSGIEKIGQLTITAPDNNGTAVSFTHCSNLRIAEGTFPGRVWFSNSGVEKIGGLTITTTDSNGNAAGFSGCHNLKVAEGNFPGWVNFSNSGIQKIGKLAITRPNSDGTKATFTGCDLRLPAEFLEPEYEMDEAIRQKSLNRIALRKAADKAQRTAPDLEI